jgi:glycerol-3-phosphate dehydrogenase
MDNVFDVAIIGGGINGCGCAADAALRGLSVVLCEQDDLASKTSSKSTKLIHGGLRYLEYFDFGLVKKALDERQKLLELAPHLVHPQSFVIPYQKNMRPSWIIRLGLFLYDHLSFANKLPRSKLIHRKQQAVCFEPLSNNIKKGFIYYDGATDDARLTIANALQAKEHGATILPQTKLIKADVIDGQWLLTLEGITERPFQIKAKSIINTAGPWVESVSELLHIPMEHTISLVKGSHFVIPKLYEGDHAYMLQHIDKRIVFTIPYHGYTMVGTTDIAFSGNLNDIHIDASEVEYLCEIINQYFHKQIHESDIISTWSGIRPLLADPGKKPSALSRDYVYHYSNTPAPAITVYGGKITTYRQLSLQAVNQLRKILPNLTDSRTDTTPLPGALMGSMDFNEYQVYAHKKYQWLTEQTRKRYLQTYGTRTENILEGCEKISDLGVCFSPTLYQVEVDYLLKEEWANNCEDILWRRTKLGLTIDAKGTKMLADYLLQKVDNPAFEIAQT